MRPFGVAVKAFKVFAGVEKTVFNYTLSAGATHGAVTQQWHAGHPTMTSPQTRMRFYIDGEAVASVDYGAFYATIVPACPSRQGDVRIAVC